MIAFLFSIPGLFEKRSLGQGVGPAEAAPVVPSVPPDQGVPFTPQPGTESQPAATPVPAKPADANTPKAAKPAPAKDAAKPGNDNKK